MNTKKRPNKDSKKKLLQIGRRQVDRDEQREEKRRNEKNKNGSQTEREEEKAENEKFALFRSSYIQVFQNLSKNKY